MHTQRLVVKIVNYLFAVIYAVVLVSSLSTLSLLLLVPLFMTLAHFILGSKPLTGMHKTLLLSTASVLVVFYLAYTYRLNGLTSGFIATALSFLNIALAITILTSSNRINNSDRALP